MRDWYSPLIEIILNYNALNNYIRSKETSKQQGQKAKIQILNLKRSMERVRKSFVEKRPDDKHLKICFVKVEEVFDLPDPEIKEIKDIESSFGGFQDLPDPQHYIFVIIDLKENSGEGLTLGPMGVSK